MRTYEYDRSKTYIVGTIIEPPYTILKNTEYPASGIRNPYTGFCADLMKLIADSLNLKCKHKPICTK